jgi:hypothetical protein
VPTPHAVLAGLFGRMPYPDLQIFVTHSMRAEVGVLELSVSIMNKGRGMAEQLFLLVDASSRKCRLSWPTGEEWHRWTEQSGGRVRFTIISSSFPPLPPGSKNKVAEIEIGLSEPEPENVVIDMTCGSRSGPGSACMIILPAGLISNLTEHLYRDYTHEVFKAERDRGLNAALEACLASTKG